MSSWGAEIVVSAPLRRHYTPIFTLHPRPNAARRRATTRRPARRSTTSTCAASCPPPPRSVTPRAAMRAARSRLWIARSAQVPAPLSLRSPLLPTPSTHPLTTLSPHPPTQPSPTHTPLHPSPPYPLSYPRARAQASTRTRSPRSPRSSRRRSSAKPTAAATRASTRPTSSSACPSATPPPRSPSAAVQSARAVPAR